MFKKILIGLFILIVLVVVFHSFIIGTIVKPQVESQVSKILGTDVRMNVLSVRLWPGNAAVYGLKIKNPVGFSDQYLLDLGSFSLGLDVRGLMRQFSNRTSGPKTIVVDEINVRGLKLLIEKIATPDGSKSNIEKIAEHVASQNKSAKTSPEEQTGTIQPAAWHVELKHFDFDGGKIVFRDKTIGTGFEYTIDKIKVDVKNIYYPAKPANELVELLDVSARIGNQKPGEISLKGKSNLMAGLNADAELKISDASIADFNAFVADQPFQIAGGKFDLDSAILIADNQLTSQHNLKLSSMELASKTGMSQLVDLPLQTLLTTLSRLPTIQFPFEVQGDLKNPQFKITQAIKAAIANGIQRVLAGGLSDLTGVAQGLKTQAVDIATESTDQVVSDAQKMVKDLAGEGTESLQGGMKKLTGLMGKKSE